MPLESFHWSTLAVYFNKWDLNPKILVWEQQGSSLASVFQTFHCKHFGMHFKLIVFGPSDRKPRQ